MSFFPAIPIRETIPIGRRERHVPPHQLVHITFWALAVLALGTPRALPGFLAPLSFDAGLIPYTVAVGDLNGDGIPDLVVANNVSNTAFFSSSKRKAQSTCPIP
jgi:hypothetical protein